MIHSTCNMGARDSPDMYALSPRACGPRASGIHIRQIPRAHVTTITYDSEFGGLTCQCHDDLDYIRSCEDDQRTVLLTVRLS